MADHRGPARWPVRRAHRPGHRHRRGHRPGAGHGRPGGAGGLAGAALGWAAPAGRGRGGTAGGGRGGTGGGGRAGGAGREHRLFQFLDVMPVAVFVTSPDGQPYYANEEFERVLGLGVVADIGAAQLARTYNAFLAGTDQPYPTERMAIIRATRGEASHLDDMEIRRTDGTVIPLEVWGRPVYGASGDVEYAIAAFADMTGRNAREKTIAGQAALLELAHDAISSGTRTAASPPGTRAPRGPTASPGRRRWGALPTTCSAPGFPSRSPASTRHCPAWSMGGRAYSPARRRAGPDRGEPLGGTARARDRITAGIYGD